jgi:hypothetical protein
MAKIDPDKDGKYKLGGSKDSDLEGIDSKKYDVFTETEKLAEAQQKFGNITWFASFTIKDKNGNPVGQMAEYTIKFDKPKSGDDNFVLYYYLSGNTYQASHQSENSKRSKATLTVGDPPMGTVP